MLDLRPARKEHFWTALARRPLAVALAPSFGTRLAEAQPGTLRAFLRDGARIAKARLRQMLDGPLLSRIFSLQHRIEAAFLASGAAAQLADAALEGETTPRLAQRIAKIARTLSRAAGAAVYLRGPLGLQMLGADGKPCDPDLAARGLASGKVEWGNDSAAVPLRVGDELVGALSLRFAGGLRDLRPLFPLLKRAGAVLAAAERESKKDRFLSLAAHELKTPLTSIKGFSYSLARRLEKGEPCDPRHVQVLERQAERLHFLLEEMLEVSRIETGRFLLHQEPCEAADLIDAAERALRRMGADGTVERRVPAALPLVADRERIERALTAMVLRARGLGPVIIEAVQRDGRIELRVAWDGDPLPEPERAQVLEPRWEAPQSQRQGLGMALSIARRAAELHGGSLRAEPLALVLELPLRSPGKRHGSLAQGRVLVVDDDEPIARMMAEFLAEHGFVSDWASSGRIALAKAETARPDVVVLDLRMPEMDGRELLQTLRARGISPRVVLFSADRAVADAARELRCEAFVEKPFAPESLLAAVRRTISASAR